MNPREFIAVAATRASLEKRAAMIDPVQDRLLPEVWGQDEKLRPDVKEKILRLLYSKVPKNRIKNIIIMGATTTFQYNPQSDLDINVSISDATDAEQGSGSSSLVSSISHIPIHDGAPRTMQYYILNHIPRTLDSFRRGSTPAYNVLDDEWLVPPVRPEDLRNPEDEFNTEFILARHYVRKFGFHAGRYKHWKGKSKERAQEHLDALYDLTDRIYLKRRKGYSPRWGEGKKDWRNVIFKTLEYSEHGEFFQEIMQKGKSKRNDPEDAHTALDESES